MILKDCHTHNLNSFDGIISIEPGFENLETGKFYSCGIHPWKTDTYNFDLLKKTLSHKNVIAIGEAGIDYLRGAPVNIQEKIFMEEIELSEIMKLPIIIHCVRASSDIIRIRKKSSAQQPWIIHGFRGGYKHACQLINAGLYISLGEYFNKDSIDAIPNERLLVETDESFISIEDIAKCIKPDALDISTNNLYKLFKL